ADERCIATAASHEELVRVGAMLQQRAGDRDRVLVDDGERQPSETEVEERRPAFRAPVFQEEVATPTRSAACAPFGSVSRARELRALSQVPENAGEIAAHDLRIETRIRDLRVASESAHRRAAGAHVVRTTAAVVVRTRVVEKPGDELRRHAVRWTGPREMLLERRPAWEPKLAGERVLNRAQCRSAGNVGQRFRESRACFVDVVSK